MELPFQRMHSLCKDDRLRIKNEGVLLLMIDKYLEKRSNNKSLKLLQEEVDPLHRKVKDWDSLIKAGILTEEEVEKKKKEEEDKEEEIRKLA